MKRVMLSLAALATLGSCERKPAIEQRAEKMLEWSKANPPVSASTWENAGTLECRASRMSVCGLNGCIEAPTSTWVMIDPSAGACQRCDARGCDSYQAAVNHGGSWTTLTLVENATFLRLTASRQYVEVAPLNNDVYIYHGQCGLAG